MSHSLKWRVISNKVLNDRAAFHATSSVCALPVEIIALRA